MIYRVKLDGNDILDYQDPGFFLLEPSLELEVNTAGSFTFTMPPGHHFYDAPQPLRSNVEVWEGETLLWFGRCVEVKTDFWKQKSVYCEGALAFFNDTVQRLHEYDSISLHSFFRTVIANHNAQVAQDRRFTVGQITLPDKQVYRKLNYDSTYDVLHRQILEAEGGYLFSRRENGVTYLDWLAELPYTCNQPVEFGLNLLDMSTTLDGGTIVTCVLPLGENDEETGEPLTVRSVNNGSDIIESESVSEFGRITKAVTFSGVSQASTLYQDGLEYLRNTQFEGAVIECSAAELHSQNPNYESFQVGQRVRCRSVPHLVDRYFPLLRMSLRLDTAAKEITLGTASRRTLSRIYKENQAAVDAVEEETSSVKEELEQMKDLSDDLDQLSSTVDDLSTDLDQLSTSVDDLNTDIDNLSTDLGNLTTDLGDLTTDVGNLSSDVGNLSSNVGNLSSDVSGLSSSVSSLSNRVTNLEQNGGGSGSGSGSGSDGWIYNVNGTVYSSGTIYITTVEAEHTGS